jgi:hypothetical protein
MSGSVEIDPFTERPSGAASPGNTLAAVAPPGQAPSVLTPAAGEKVVRIFFFRHAESCANMLKKLGRKTEQSSYLDPDITRRGAAIANLVGRRLQENRTLDQGMEGTPIRIGASVLLRAQQTADILRRNVGVLEGQRFIQVFPFIGEMSQKTGAWFAQSVGYGKDNQPMSRNAKVAISSNPFNPPWKREKIPVQLDYRPYDDAATLKPETVDPVRFIAWLGKNLRGIFGDDIVSRSDRLRLVVITHAGWLEKLTGLEGLGEPIHFDNVEGTAIEIKYSADGVKLDGPRWVPQLKRIKYYDVSDIAREKPCPDSCLSGTICSGVSEDILERIRLIAVQVINNNAIPHDDIKTLENDMRITELYASSPNRVIIQTLDRMKGYRSDASSIIPDLITLVQELANDPSLSEERERINRLLSSLVESGVCIPVEILLRKTEGYYNAAGEFIPGNPETVTETNISTTAKMTRNKTHRQLLETYVGRGLFGKKSRKTMAGNIRRILRESGTCKLPALPPALPTLQKASIAPEGSTPRYGQWPRFPIPRENVAAAYKGGPPYQYRHPEQPAVQQPVSSVPLPGSMRYGARTGAVGTAKRRTWGEWLGGRGGARRTRRHPQRKRRCTRGRRQGKRHTRRR